MKNGRAYQSPIADELRRQGVEIEMTVEETAVYLNVTPRLIYELVVAEQIPVRKIKLPGRKRPILRFSRTALDQWRDECSKAAA
ncbi:MAG: helix-turn-helix domain-containing protein [Blastocatellia bacterium]